MSRHGLTEADITNTTEDERAPLSRRKRPSDQFGRPARLL
jgi:hypothetical protein